MNSDLMFLVANIVALVGWIALIVGKPGEGHHVTVARAVGLGLALIYLSIFLANGQGLLVLARDYSLNGIGTLFASPELRLLGWIHYLAFDLWVGSWEVEEAGRGGVSRAVLIPCLVLTWALGPLGLLAFVLARRLIGDRAAER
jgi:hypothetical protein